MNLLPCLPTAIKLGSESSLIGTPANRRDLF
jgi:hypothetical protein